jgi:hypothetical protein
LEKRLDRQSDPRLFELDLGALPKPVALGRDELDLDELERAIELASPESLVAEQHAARMAAGELEHRFALLAGLGPTRS